MNEKGVGKSVMQASYSYLNKNAGNWCQEAQMYI